jgi:hypothetical protein
MNSFSLYRRITEQDTLSEAPNEFPDPRFALPTSVYWMSMPRKMLHWTDDVNWLSDLKQRIQLAQRHALFLVNRELILLYLRRFTDGRPNPEFVQQPLAQLLHGQTPS